MSVPGSWKVLIDRKEELHKSLIAMRGIESVLVDKLQCSRERQSSVKLDITDIEESLKMLGWMPEKVDQ